MTDHTDAEVEGSYAGRSMAEIIDDYVMVRGDLTEQYARTQLLRIIAAREAAARADERERVAAAIEAECADYYTDMQNEGFGVAARIARTGRRA